jgi:hypothetical protein
MFVRNVLPSLLAIERVDWLIKRPPSKNRVVSS